MTAGPAEKATRRSRTSPLDLATVEAVHELRASVRLLRDLNDGGRVRRSPLQESEHNRRVVAALRRRTDARANLERLLEEDG